MSTSLRFDQVGFFLGVKRFVTNKSMVNQNKVGEQMVILLQVK